jgi:subtilisin family serine protease
MGRLNWRRLQITVGAVALLMLTVAAASAQFTPNFRAPTMVPMMPIGPRDPGFHAAPGDISNIPMSGGSNTGTLYYQKGTSSATSKKRAAARQPSSPKIIRQGTTGGGAGGGPPISATGFVPNEVLVELRGNPSAQVIDTLLRRNRLALLERLAFRLTDSTILRLRISDGRSVAVVMRALQAGGAAAAVGANHRYVSAEEAAVPAPADAPAGTGQTKSGSGDPAQYALAKLHLLEAQRVATGDKVPVAIIDSGIDSSHPDLTGAIAGEFDALGGTEPPHAHGTGVAGIVAAHGRLLGAAPAARILAVRALGAAASGANGTTFNILKGLDWADGQGARIINLSFTGPSDALLARALAALRQKGTILIAAVGNAGPKSPPLYPAGDPNVIAVTATDAADKLLAQANRGGYIAVAAPGVEILVLAPGAAYQLSSGTSFAAAYVTGIAALMLERRPGLDVETLKKALQSTAKDLGPKGRDDQFGAGLADAYQAIVAVDPSADASARATRP